MNRNSFPPVLFSVLASCAAIAIAAPNAHAKGFFEPLAQVGRAASQAGKEVGKAVQNTGREVGKGVKNTGREVGRGAKNVARFGRDTQRGFRRDFDGQQPPNPYRLTLSRYFADSTTLSRGAGSLNAFDFEYDTRVNKLLAGPTVIGIYADINSGGRYGRRNSAQYDADIVGVGFLARRIFSGSLESSHFYAGGGIGFYETTVNIDPLGPRKYLKTDYAPGVRLLGGYHFSRSFYAQLDILALDSFRKINANGAQIRINPSGARFGFGYRF